ncbi:MAG: fibronectin type III domain-containing protein [Acidobacteriota bacterium]
MPRYWNFGAPGEKLVIADLPILEFENFTAYGNLVGFRLRFSNHDSVDWYNEQPFRYHHDLGIVCGGNLACAGRNRQVVEQLTLWNNEQAFRMRYVADTDWQQVDAINRLVYEGEHPADGRDGAEFRFKLTSQSFTDLSIDGYQVAGWIQNDIVDQVRPEITFHNPPNYSNYVNRDTWIKGTDPLNVPCPRPNMLQTTAIGSTTATVSWQAGTNNTHYLVRYQPRGAQHWEFQQAPSLSAALTGLEPGTLYDFHVSAGCSVAGDERNLSFWSPRASFTTN